ncbi:NAD(P)-dependent oxidoreductase [Myxococcus xanthus]|uniref:NAD(P)-dependent oxidoreductase n=1 Tax=Myxococcus xanthus TaxID=34 RepID=A0AAE6G1Y0_MYXXA|nr:SDR family oxidoreductase [Myxococcus xanthus]QDE69393.1 NAD(P)-dependent oxidoreductase [Myxococcus xanthus]QDE76670.1 NAD(P)-dependent oxidoreductase [Myxococcus xanthus]QDF05955.1 NAD(P)-dependent oxidoreductase [Myxococcus xanthus]
MTPQRIAVFGATGTVGSLLVDVLVKQGHQVRALSRKATARPDAEAVRFDFSQPSKLGAILEGVDAAYLLMPADSLNVIEYMGPVIRAAAERGVKVVFQSVMGVEANEADPYRQVELQLERSGVPYVILRPNWFSDNFHLMWSHDIRAGQLPLPAGTGETSFIDARDIAEAAAAALTTRQFDGQAFTLTGPQALSFANAAAVISRVTGRPLEYVALSEGAFILRMRDAGFDTPYAEMLAELFAAVREQWTATTTDGVQLLTGHAPRSFEQYAEERMKP